MDVLLVDDHPIIHETMRAIVRSVRPEAAFHSQFELGAALLHAERLPALRLVLVDLGLPGCSGLDALLKFRNAFPQARVAVVSAAEEPARMSAALEAGAAGYLPKTLLPKVMARALQHILDGGTYSPLEPAPEPH